MVDETSTPMTVDYHRSPAIQQLSAGTRTSRSNSRRGLGVVDPISNAVVSTSSRAHHASTKHTLSNSRSSAASSDDLSKPSPSTPSPPSTTARTSALQTLRMTLRRTTSQRCSISTTGTSVVTVANDDDAGREQDGVANHQQFSRPDQQQHQLYTSRSKAHKTARHEDDEEDIAMLQPEEEEVTVSPAARAHRWRRSFSSMRMAIAKKKNKAAPTLFSISFYPWKRDPRAYYSHPEAAAEWVPDTASKRCQICLTSFHLTRRRHHCRLCGLLACNDCSLPRTYFPFSKDNRSQHHLIKDGAPQRTCNACAGTLQNMVAQSDPRVKHVPVRSPAAANPFDDNDSDNDGKDDDVNDAGSWHASIGRDDDIYVVDNSRVQLARAPRGAMQSQSDELDEVLRARAQSRKNPQPKYYVVSSVWLEQWLQHVHIDAPPASHGLPSRRHRSTTSARAPRNARRPGPIANYALLNFVSGKLFPKHGLERSRGNDAGGDYRIVSEEVWIVFLRHYGGGPCIQLRPDDDPSPRTASHHHALVRKHPASRNGSTGTGPTDVCRWVIVELDDTIPLLIASEPADLLKGNKNMRRVASANALTRCHRSSLKHMSSVHPFHETAPCVLRDVDERPQQQRHTTAPCFVRDASERSLPYYPRNSVVNCIAPPPSTSSVDRGGKRSQVQQHRRHFDYQRHEQRQATTPTTKNRTESRTANAKVANVSVETVLYEPASVSAAAGDADSDSDHTPRATIAAVSAFALAAAEARKKSALSLSRHSSALSSSIVKASHASASA